MRCRSLGIVVGSLAWFAGSRVAQAQLNSFIRSPVSNSSTDIDVAALRGGRANSMASMPRGMSSESFITLESSYRKLGDIPEFRAGLLATDAITLDPSYKPVSGRLKISRTQFDISIATYQDENISLRTRVHLPMNSVESTNKKVAAGAEFGGVGATLDARVAGNSRFAVTVTNRESPKLQLHDRNVEIMAGAFFELQDATASNALVRVLVGPEFVYSIAPNSPDVAIQYGMQWGARARVETETGKGTHLNFKWHGEAMLRRITSYTIADVVQGGAGLFTVMPGMDYHVVDSLWLGITGEIPVFRPKTRETAFGDVGLPGLFGGAVALNIRAVAL